MSEINHEQFEQMVSMVDDYLAIGRRWVHKLAHQAEGYGLEESGNALHEAMRALDEARSYIDEAKVSIDD